MEPKPVERSKTPSYPTRRDVLAGGAAFVLAALGGQWKVFAADKEGKIVVAPIFEHGKGRGAEGCIVMSPPVFLSEEEAMQIVREELAKEDIQLKAGRTLKDAYIPWRMKVSDKTGKQSVQEMDGDVKSEADAKAAIAKRGVTTRLRHRPLKLSGIDDKKKVGVKFIAVKNYYEVGGLVSTTTVQSYDFKEVAQYVAEKVKTRSNEPIYLGVFYDPAAKFDMEVWRKKREETDSDTAWKQTEEQGKQEAKKLLRQQVQDFADWLKKQKVIQEQKPSK
jgi:hypothetical protein